MTGPLGRAGCRPRSALKAVLTDPPVPREGPSPRPPAAAHALVSVPAGPAAGRALTLLCCLHPGPRGPTTRPPWHLPGWRAQVPGPRLGRREQADRCPCRGCSCQQHLGSTRHLHGAHRTDTAAASRGAQARFSPGSVESWPGPATGPCVPAARLCCARACAWPRLRRPVSVLSPGRRDHWWASEGLSCSKQTPSLGN